MFQKANVDTIRGPPSRLLCQLFLTWVATSVSLNVAFSVFNLTVGTDRWTDRRTDGQMNGV